jgi:hypothetical protein
MKNLRVCAFVCFGILVAWQLAALSEAGNAMGKYNLGVGIIHRARLAAQSGAPVSRYHDATAEAYIVLSGSGVLTTGGTINDKKPSANYNILNGPGGNGTPGQDPDRVLPGGYVNPLLLKNQLPQVK